MPPSQNRNQKLTTKGKSDAASATQPQRPQTRAWVKQEAQRQKLTTNPSRTSPVLGEANAPPTSRYFASAAVAEKRRGRVRKGTDIEDIGNKQIPEVAPAVIPDRGEEAGTEAAGTRSAHLLRGAESGYSVVPLWLSGVSPASAGRSNPDFPGGLPPISFLTQPQSSMDSSSSASKTSALASEDLSTIKGSGIKKDKALTWAKLRLRRISKTRLDDEKSQNIRSRVASEPLKIKFKDVAGLRAILQDFIDECDKSGPNQNSYQAIESLSNKFSEWKPTHRLASITNHDFDRDVTHCKSSNEAVIQRTIMISIIDRWQFHEFFVFNCEGQWKLNAIHLLPTTGRKEGITLPKPDLAVFFKLSALTGETFSAPTPRELNHCLSPDGDEDRCFPFFFIEVKRAAGDLNSAFLANMHSASQALYNIYIWMSQTQQKAVFFDKVRVFTMDLNVQEINLRMHRAILTPQNGLSFHFDDIVSITPYNRDKACHLVRDILLEYAAKELHPILQSTFQEVSAQEEMLANVEVSHSKRKADLAVVAEISKRSRSHVGSAVRAMPPPQQTPSDTTSSFGASGLSLIADPL